MFGESRLRCNRRMQACRNFPASLLYAAAFLLASCSGATADPPLPRERPKVVPGERLSTSESGIEPSPCQTRLAKLAEFKPSPAITGPGECMATDVVTVGAVLLADNQSAMFSPPVTLRCPMAEAVAQWIADDVAPAIGALGAPLRSIETLDSFDCRPRNGVAGAPLSEHGRANALDVHSFKLANGAVVELTNANVSKVLRERLRERACARFTTVLGNGADAYHEGHVHIDLMERTGNYKICQWEVLDAAETAALIEKKAAQAARMSADMTIAADLPLPRPRPATEAAVTNLPSQSEAHIFKEGTMRRSVALSVAATVATSGIAYAEEQTVTVGPWTISTSYKGDKFDSCSMSRSVSELGITFVRGQDGLLLLLDSQKWKLERGKAYSVRLVAGFRSVEAKALAEPKAVTIALADRTLNERLQTADVLEVRGEGATLRVPLDGSATAFGRLQACFDKNSQVGVETNPFVAPSRKP
jgi:hypothetical protein